MFSGPRTVKCAPRWSTGVIAVGVGVDARLLVGQHRVVVPAVPQLLARRSTNSVGAGVSVGVVRVGRSRPKLRASSWPAGGDDVPAGPAAAEVVQRGERPRQRCTARCRSWTPWRSARRARCAAASAASRVSGSSALCVLCLTLPCSASAVGEEDRVEHAALGDLREPHVVLQVEGGRRGRARVAARPPRGGRCHQERVEVEPSAGGASSGRAFRGQGGQWPPAGRASARSAVRAAPGRC